MLVLDIVTSALRQIGIIGETEDPSAEQGDDATEKLNDMMFELQGRGVELGWNPKEDTADVVLLPKDLHKGIKAQLAVYLAGEYGVVDIPAKTVADAMESESRMIRDSLIKKYKTTDFRAMPMGSVVSPEWDIDTGA